MKAVMSHLRLLVALALTLGLSACGGYSSVELGGTVTGLTTDGLILADGNNTVAIPANVTSYTFPTQIDNQASYAVTVQAQPARLTCILANAIGTATGVPINWVNVSCTPNTYNLGGAINGLTSGGLVLVNGSDTVSPAANDLSFVFPTKVADGSVYGVAVLTQPPGLTCSVANGTSVMGPSDVQNVQVTCHQ
jgi:hypothetical protein